LFEQRQKEQKNQILDQSNEKSDQVNENLEHANENKNTMHKPELKNDGILQTETMQPAQHINEIPESYEKNVAPAENKDTSRKPDISSPAAIMSLSKREFDIAELTVTGSVFGTYITAVDENNLYLIDQHAAHERIFYEQLLKLYKNEEKTQQLILTPYIINVTHAVKNDAGGMLDFLGNLGYQIEEFGPTAYIIKAIPAFMEFEESKDFIDYLLDNISEEADLENQKKISAIITNACKKSVKAHDVLEKKEIEHLIADLAKTENPYSCPHGRPTFIRLNKYEIEKMFKRV